jgi:RNA-directed DNA polymerase
VRNQQDRRRQYRADKLDTEPHNATIVAVNSAQVAVCGSVNGPQGPTSVALARRLPGIDWDGIDWSVQEERVRRLRGRIFTAAQEGDLRKVRNLQKLMLRSLANTLVSVRRVTQSNAGRHTPGVDGQLALTAVARAELAVLLHTAGPGQALPVRRVHIPKKGGTRPLGIPVIADRAQQQRVRNALEPEWEARLDRKQYGFRPGRGCHDAVEMIHRALAAKGATRQWILDGDLSSAFDRIDHEFLLDRIGTFPAREQIRAWLEAGVIDRGRYAPTEEGTPQGGVISPLLLNIALQGMEAAAGVEYDYRGYVKPGRPTVITYADDFVALCSSRQQAETVRSQLSTWLAARGLSLNQSKTRIVHVDDGFDFLSFTIRRYHTSSGTKVLTKPSRDAMRKIRQRNAAELRELLHSSPTEVIARMNPIIRGQANYFRPGASKRAYQALDDHLWQHITKWARRRHPRKSRRWIAQRYFGAFHPTRADRWIFGDRASGAYLHRYAWTPIVRHAPVPGRYSPDDPALACYWADRRRKSRPPQLAPSWERLIRAQHGRCPACGLPLLQTDQPPDSPSQWEQWYRTVRRSLTHQGPTPGSRPTIHRLVHVSCAPSPTRKRSRTTATTADPAPP